MAETKEQKIKRERLERNQEIANAVKNGEYIAPRMDIQQSWFPNRGVIKKDKKAMQLLHEGTDNGKAT